MASNPEIRRTFFPFGFSYEYNISRAISENDLSLVVAGCLQKLLGPDILNATHLTDIKGRDSNQLLLADTATAQLPSGEEIFYLSGDVGAESEDDSLIWTPFKVELLTEFAEFKGDHHIVHRTKLIRSSDMPAGIDPILLGSIFPLKPKLFRVGLELFKSRFMSGFFGFAPTVQQGFYIDATQTELRLRIFAEGLPRRDSPVLADAGWNRRIKLALGDMLELSNFS